MDFGLGELCTGNILSEAYKDKLYPEMGTELEPYMKRSLLPYIKMCTYSLTIIKICDL